MAQLAERLGLDLPDALTGDREALADLFQRVLALLADAEPESGGSPSPSATAWPAPARPAS